MPGIREAFDLIGEDIVELPRKKESMKNKINFYDENWLEESKGRLLKQFKDGQNQI